MPTPEQYFEPVAATVVTGGSSGIGNSLIKAVKNVKPDGPVCNLSRTQPDDFPEAGDRHLATDLTSAESMQVSVDQLVAWLSGLPSGPVVLINNSGFGDYGALPSLDREKQLRMIDLNVRSVADLTLRLLPALLERGGAVVTVASTAAFQPTPYLATYGATKAFDLHWALALDEDLRGTGVRSLAVCPGPTRSNFFKAAGFAEPPVGDGGPAGGGMSSETVAWRTLRALARGKTLEVTGWRNKWIAFAGGLGPRVWTTRVGGAILRRMRLERHRADNGGNAR